MQNPDLPKLLRALAGGTDAKARKHDVIFNAAADELERLDRATEHFRAETAKQSMEPHLGCATTKHLIDELRARFGHERSSQPNYRTIDG